MDDSARACLVGRLKDSPRLYHFCKETLCRLELEVDGTTFLVIAKNAIAEQAATLDGKSRVCVEGKLAIEPRELPLVHLLHVEASSIEKVP